MSDEPEGRSSRPRGPGARTIFGFIVAALVVVFIAINRDDTEISFIFFSAQTSLWIALAVAAAGGYLAGVLSGRKWYRTPRSRRGRSPGDEDR